LIQLNSRLPTLKAQPCLPSSKCKQKSKVLEESVRIIEGPYYKLLVINLKKQNNNFKATLKKNHYYSKCHSWSSRIKKTPVIIKTDVIIFYVLPKYASIHDIKTHQFLN